MAVDAEDSILTLFEYDARGNFKAYDKSGAEVEYTCLCGKVSTTITNRACITQMVEITPPPEVGLYLDASPIFAVIDNAYIPRCLGRNIVMCNNKLELAPSPYTAYTATELSADGNYDINANLPWYVEFKHWYCKTLNKITNWLDEHKVCAIIAMVVIYGIMIATMVATWGTSAGWYALGGLIGASIGLGNSIVSQGVTQGWDNINPYLLLLDTLFGAISGMVGMSSWNRLTTAIIGGGLGFAGSVLGDFFSNNGSVNWEKAMIMILVGEVIGAVTVPGAMNVDLRQIGQIGKLI